MEWPRWLWFELTFEQNLRGQSAPWYMGLVDYSLYRAVAFFCPLPFNLLIRFCLDAYRWTRAQHDSAWLYKNERREFSRGYQQGGDEMRSRLSKAYLDGWKDACREIRRNS